MAGPNKVSKEVEIRYSTPGLDQARAKSDALAKTQDGVTKSTDAATASSERSGRTARSVADAVERFAEANERALRIQQQMADSNDAVARSLDDMAKAQSQAVQGSAALARAANDNVSALDRIGGAFKTAGKFAVEHPVLVLAASSASASALSYLSAIAATSLAAASVATARFANDNAAMGRTVTSAAGAASTGLRSISLGATATAAALSTFAEKTGNLSGGVSLLVSGLRAVAPALAPAILAVTAFELVSAAIEKAYRDYDKLVDLGRRAEKLDLSSSFLKGVETIGDRLELGADQMKAAVEHASAVARDIYGQQSAIAAVFAGLQPGDAGVVSARTSQQMDLAQNAEQRVKAALAGMVELEAAGKRVAALDIAGKVFGSDFAERLRISGTSIAEFASALDEAKDKQLLRQDDVTRAVALQREIEGVKREIDAAVSVTFDFSRGAIALNEPWLALLKTIRDVAKAAEESIKTGDNATLAQIRRLQAQVEQMQTVALPRAIAAGDTVVADSLRSTIGGFQAQIDALSTSMPSATAKIDAAIGTIAQALPPVSEELVRLIAEAERAKSTLPGLDGALNGIAGSAANAAGKIGSVAAGLRALQGLNPDLSGALGYLDKVKGVNDAFERTKQLAINTFEKSGNAQQAEADLNNALRERERTLKAIGEQQGKNSADYVKSGDLSKLTDEGRALAQNAENWQRVRQERQAYFEVLTKSASTPEDADRIRRQGEAELARIDASRKLLDAKTRTDAAAARAASASSGAGDDAYDNALKRSRDQVQEFELQARAADKAGEEVYKLTEANRLRRAAASAARADEAGISDAIDQQAAAYARARKASEDAVEAQRRLQDGQREVASEFARFADDVVLGGAKMGEAFSLLAKSLSSGSIRALLTGEGPLAGLLGTAPTEKGGVGGLLGGQLSLGKMFDTSGLRDAIGEGAYTGITDAFGPLLKPKAGANGQSGGFMSSPLGQGLGVAAVGAGVGYSSASPLAGALAGGMAGLMTGNPLLAVAGAGAGLIGGLLGQSEAKKAAKKRLQEQIQALKDAYKEALPQIEQLRATLRGEATGGTEGQIRQAFAEMIKANKVASDGGDQAAADRIAAEFTQYAARLRTEGSRRLEGMLRDMGAGQGVDGAFAQAANQAQALGEALKSFVADAKLYGEANQARARAAAQEAALASLDAPKTLSETQARLRAIDGTATALNQVLQDLGLSADQAAAAIRDRTAKALDALRATFSADLDRKLNDATDRGYLNDVADLLKERQTLLSDAAALGMDPAKVEAYVTAALQKVVNESELTGDAFADLVKAFPALSGRVTEFTAALDTAAAKAAAAARALGYQDRLFAATNDTSSLEGQLRAYDRQAARERLEEQKAGGQALSDLIAAQTAERLKIETDYYAAVADTQKQAAEQAKQAYDATFRSIRDYVTGLTTGADSPLSPGDRLAAAQADYQTKLTAAQGGDRDALDGITAAAEAYRTAAQAMYASGAGYQAAFAAIRADLSKLPDQVSPEQFVVDAITALRDTLSAALQANSPGLIATALNDNFRRLDTSVNGLLDYGEFLAGVGPLATKAQQDRAEAVFRSIDADGDGMLSALELLRTTLKAAIEAGSAQATAAALLPQFGALTAATGGLLDLAQFKVAIGSLATVSEQQAAKAIFAAIDADGDGQLTKLELIRAQAGATAANTAAATGAINASNDIASQQKAVLDSVSAFTAQTRAAVDAGNAIANAVVFYTGQARDLLNANNTILSAINGLSAVQRDQLTLLTTQFTQSTVTGVAGKAISNTQISALNKIAYNTALTDGARNYGAGQYATGGWIRGPGTGTSDSISLMGSNGEFMVNALSARAAGPWLEAMNDNPGLVPAMPVPVAMPSAGSGLDVGALVAEIRALRSEAKAQAEMIGRLTKAAGDRVAAEVEANTEAVEDGNADRRKSMKAGSRTVGRGDTLAA